MKKYVIIVAGGAGRRMKSVVPKQFIALADKPILMRTIEKFYCYDNDIQIITVLPAEQIEFWETLCEKYKFDISHRVIAGGETRFYSVKNGLALVETPSLVAVHDGVRPLVSAETIARCFAAAERYGATIPVVNPVDSLRQIIDNKSVAVDRSRYRIVQTPQIFDAELLKNAYLQNFTETFTDDATVVESAGNAIHLVEGNRENIKITTETDLKIANTLINVASTSLSHHETLKSQGS
jgi:2-C-methyl-D-erythritol 4-phosphate cytidylyltransferase